VVKKKRFRKNKSSLAKIIDGMFIGERGTKEIGVENKHNKE
jgi:hypothetical protein